MCGEEISKGEKKGQGKQPPLSCSRKTKRHTQLLLSLSYTLLRHSNSNRIARMAQHIPPPFPFPQRPSGESSSHQLFYSRSGVYNPFFSKQNSPILHSNFIYSSPPPLSQSFSSFSSPPESEIILSGSESYSTGGVSMNHSSHPIATEPTTTEQEREEYVYEYSLEMNPAWIERLSNTMKRIKKKKKKRYPY
jgi:hypothetical protein